MAYILLLVLLSLWVGLFLNYYRKQNAGGRIGGPISKPKAYWLGLTTFSYFILPWWTYVYATGEDTRTIALWAGGLLAFRAAFQFVLMYWIKKWSPPMGMTFNLVYTLLLLVQGTPLDTPNAYLVTLYWTTMMLTDTLFAWQFFKIVGAQTKGPQAIWYADESPVYRAVNQQTRIANLVFTCWAYLVVQTVVGAHFFT